MQCQMYSLKPFDKKLRTEFVLPHDPYSTYEEDVLVATEYLRSLGVFFFRDEINPEAIIIEHGSPVMTERSGFLAYYSAVELEFNLDRQGAEEFTDIGVAPWDRPSAEIIKKNGDDRAWLSFNQTVTIMKVELTRITRG